MLVGAMILMMPESSAWSLILAMMTVGQLVDQLMKGAMEVMGKGKSVRLVPLELVDLAKPPL